MTQQPDIKTKPAFPDIDISATDLWCGAGGTTSGLIEAAAEMGIRLQLKAANHWMIAYETYKSNHPEADVYCKSVDSINPLDLFPDRRLQLLIASPECTHHSRARGGKPKDEQSRADVWDLKRWISNLFVETIIIENVPEFTSWGPLGADGKPLKSKKGVFFNQFIDFLKVLYNVEWRILNCADFGDATTRERFFLIAKRSKRRKIVFPEPTHASRAQLAKQKIQPSLYPVKSLKVWKPAKDIIDWTDKGESIFMTPEEVKENGVRIKRPLAPNTLRRIFSGLFKYSLKPFLLNNKNTDRRDRSIEEPCFTQTTSNHQCVVTPFLTQFFGENNGQKSRVRSLEEPLWTITAQNRTALVSPYLMNLTHSSNNHDSMCYSAEEPLKTICGKGMFALLKPFIVKYYNGSDFCSLEEPLPTITASYEHLAVAEPVIKAYREGVEKSGIGLTLQPYLVRFKNNQTASSIHEPLNTLTTKSSYGLVIPQIGICLDINFRMLKPEELALASSFPKSYSFAGTKQQVIKQIGNAVPVKTAKKLCIAALSDVIHKQNKKRQMR